MFKLNAENNILEGVLKLSDCEREFIVKWLSGSSQASFFIGDTDEEMNRVGEFITGKKICYIDLESFLSYLVDIKEIASKYRSMYYGPIDRLDNIIGKFSKLKPEDAKIVLSYSHERYIRILNDKSDLKTNEPLFGISILENGTDFRYSFVGGITKIKIKKQGDSYTIFINLLENWRDVIMQENGKKVDLDSIIKIFNDEIKRNVDNGKTQNQAAEIFGIKYAPLLENNKHKFTYKDIVIGSNYNNDSIKTSIKNGIELSSSVIWTSHTKDSCDNEQPNSFNVYGIHITGENSALDENNPHVCIGWSVLGDLTSICDKNSLTNRYLEINPNHSNQKRGANISQIWMFKDEMKVNDYVVYFDRGTAHIGKVIGDYRYIENTPNQDSDYVNNRKVEWIKDLAYKDLPEEYRNSSKTQKSFFRLESYKPLIQDIINGNGIQVDEFDDYEDDSINMQNILPIFDFTSSTITDGQNLIVYGTPGCGKSYYVEHTLLKDYPKENYIRTTFFQDYTNTDFVGQILPKVEGEKVTYEFNPGPFTLALEQAIKKPNEKIALVIEELNRGSAASIFGDIFQLLDRKNGVSEYSITNVNVINYLEEKFKGQYVFSNIKLPGNLSIFATMNTSDQNVFILDTAFKRRWKFKKLLNEFDSSHVFKSCYIPGANITWQEFVDGINAHILRVSTGLNSEDKQLGVYFVEEKGMRKDANEVVDETAVEDFAYKVLEYLWADVAKFDRTKWFNEDIKCLDDLVKEYKKSGIGVFNHDVFNK